MICTSHNQRGVVNYELARRRIWQTKSIDTKTKHCPCGGLQGEFEIWKWESTSKVLRAADH